MIKKISTLALAALIALPSAVSAGGADDISAKIDRLTQELSRLKNEMAQLKEKQADAEESIEEKAEQWDLASRFQLSGDFRTMLAGMTADSPSHYTALNVAQGVVEVLDAGAAFKSNLANFGLSEASSINSMMTNMGPLLANEATFVGGVTNAPGSTITQAQAEDLWAVFGDPNVQGLMANFAMAGYPVGALTSAFADTESLVGFMKMLSPATRASVFATLGYQPNSSQDYDDDTIWTNRLRLNMRVKATENMEFKGRLAMYKAWGMQNNPVDTWANGGMGGGPFMLNSLTFDGNSSRQPTDNKLVVDRAFINWNDIADQPIWFSIGRRPTTDGPPAQLRLGADKKMATPVNYMDYPFDGFSLGYAYDSLFGVEDFPGRVRFCYGRGFEAGPSAEGNGLNDVDFGGLSWDVYHEGDRFFNFQSFIAANMFNVPDNVDFVNPVEFQSWLLDNTKFNPIDPSQNLKLDRANLGDIYHTSAVYMNKVNNLNYFLVGGWSRTDPRGYDELGISLLGHFWQPLEKKDGYSYYAGIRYDIPDQPWKVGLEYNHGTKNWIAFTPGNDDLYASKLATRGDVYEAYAIWNIPAGEAISKFGRAFVRIGYQHYEYDYTGSGFWLGEPVDIDQLANDPLNAQFYTPVESMDQIYVSLEAWF